MTDNIANQKYPVLPLRDFVVFPYMITPLFVGRERSIDALNEVLDNNKKILLSSQVDYSCLDPDINQLHSVGTVANVLQIMKIPDGTVKVLVEGLYKVKILSDTGNDKFFEVFARVIHDDFKKNTSLDAMVRVAIMQFEEYIKLSGKAPKELISALNSLEDNSKIIYTICAHLLLKINDRQKFLEINQLEEALNFIIKFIEKEISILQTEKTIRDSIKNHMKKVQKEYYLNEQIKAIQKELGDTTQDELDNLRKQVLAKTMPKEAKDKCLSELKKLSSMNAVSAEAVVARNYIDWLLCLPWNKKKKTQPIDLAKALAQLNEDHYGLEKIKDRVIEYLAVQKRTKKNNGSILCLVGPPGVGKTSFVKSIAKASDREFVRVSLGGVYDECEIRGHRKTYIGAMPGKIIQSMKKVKYSNVLFLLDEIDKICSDYRGDPASALLEVLDPEHNSSFQDNYIEVNYDLSNIFFVCTANSLNMPQPLLDRMEIIHLSGYTEDEKLAIAKNYLLSKQRDINGLKENEITISDDSLLDIIRFYTREAGVRELDRQISKLLRKVVKQIVEKSKKTVAINKIDILKKYLGVQKYKYGQVSKSNEIGVVTGLAWTEFGGDILSIESIILPGKGDIVFTGSLGNIMQESIKAAKSYVYANLDRFGIDYHELEKKDIHVHFPEGAIPKDGPSAGAGICLSILSVLLNLPVLSNIAMTGEITLRGKIIPIGGLKEKLLAALRSGIDIVLVPEENKKELSEIPDKIKKSLKIIQVSHISEVFKYSFSDNPKDFNWDDIVRADCKKIDENNIITH